MEEVIIRGKTFTKQEVEEKGRQKIKVITNIFRWIGVGLFGLGILGGIVSYFSLPPEADMTTKTSSILAGAMFVVPGIVFFVISFKKRDPFEYGKKEIEKNFPAPVGFDEKVIDVLEGDKTILLSKNPTSKLIIASDTKKYQILLDKHYSRIFTPEDLIDYEIRVDNEVVITSKTKNKKSASKAIIGGLLLGEEGAIAGAIASNSDSTTTQTQKEIHHYSLVLRVNDLIKPSFIINLDSIQVAEDVATSLTILTKSEKSNANHDAKDESEKIVKQEASFDKFEEIKKYKDLLDNGIITQEEFDAKKKELL